MTTDIVPPRTDKASRWRFFRDVLVFQLKMLLGNFRDWALIPVSLVAAGIDLVFRGEREGSLFYRVLRWGWHSEEVLNVYGPIKHETDGVEVNPNYTVDSVIGRLEAVVMREYEKGGTAASIKSAMDRVIDQVHRETGEKARWRGKRLWSRPKDSERMIKD
jgi:hypothetical protein